MITKVLLERALGLPLDKIRDYQDIISAQMNGADLGYGKCKVNQRGLLHLQVMEMVCQAAVDIIEFEGDKDTWLERINNLLK